ncbi:hypothetical protein EYF80_030158 [Liparis tanakae]|uniref:Secreted protein n=1 Tax=Liparis tanakae TaxID=230148 RepID=A0A4Z2H1E6_9TELE|nr:hypothetical protein EYF80_030158 [Liparis tanakae]
MLCQHGVFALAVMTRLCLLFLPIRDDVFESCPRYLCHRYGARYGASGELCGRRLNDIDCVVPPVSTRPEPGPLELGQSCGAIGGGGPTGQWAGVARQNTGEATVNARDRDERTE